MSRPSATTVLGSGALALSALLLLWLIPVWVVTPNRVRAVVLSPDFWPNIVAALIGGLGALLLVLHALRRGAPEPVDPAAAPPTGPNASGEGRIALAAVLMALYYWLIEPIGMIFASMLAYAAFVALARSAILHKRVVAAAVLLAALLPIALHLFFGHVAGVPVPQAAFFRFP